MTNSNNAPEPTVEGDEEQINTEFINDLEAARRFLGPLSA